MVDAHQLIPILEMELLDVLSFVAITTTLGMFLCGIPICVGIFKKGTSDGISAAPFLVGSIGSLFWLRYGFLKNDSNIVTINAMGSFLQVSYLIFYYNYTRQKSFLNKAILSIVVLMGSVVYYVSGLVASGEHQTAVDHLGLVCTTFNILTFASPLAGLKDVLRIKSTENLPLPLCAANLLVSAQWCAYGFLVNDPYLKIPNTVGIVLALIQLSLFVVYPSKRAHVT